MGQDRTKWDKCPMDKAKEAPGTWDTPPNIKGVSFVPVSRSGLQCLST
jgi:hypothetical protein